MSTRSWVKVLGMIAGVLSAAGTTWKAFDAVDNLHDTILANKEAVSEMLAANNERHSLVQVQIADMAAAVRMARDRDREIVVDLRIAIAALQASQDARSGRVAYVGIESLLDDPPAVDPPRTARDRVSQSRRADADAHDALTRAMSAQMAADLHDPLDGL